MLFLDFFSENQFSLQLNLLLLDLRDDKQFFIDHPGAVPITTAQVYCPLPYKELFCVSYFNVISAYENNFSVFVERGRN